MRGVLVNVSYCGAHCKGNEAGPFLDGALHAEWLELAVDRLLAYYPGMTVVVSATGFPGIVNVRAGRERDALWRLWERVRFVTMPENPSHQVGAAWCVRMGLEYAGKLGYRHMIHTAEDVVERPGSFEAVLDRLSAGNDYVGTAWGPGGTQLNSQFFGCAVRTLAGRFSPPEAPEAGCLEAYLARLLDGARLTLLGELYDHTHDFVEWKRMAGGVAK